MAHVFEVVIPDAKWLPRRWKKAWRKMLAGRFLTSREWAIVGMLSSRRRSSVKYVRFPFTFAVVPRAQVYGNGKD